MTSPINETPAEPTDTPIEAARSTDVHLPAPPGVDAFADPEQNPCIVPDVEAHGREADQAGEPGARKTRDWPIATPTWQGVEI